MTYQDLNELFDNGTLSRASALRRQGKVLKVEHSKHELKGQVRGSAGERYRVRIDLSDIDDHECSCPVGYFCKHTAAVLGQAIDNGWLEDVKANNGTDDYGYIDDFEEDADTITVIPPSKTKKNTDDSMFAGPVGLLSKLGEMLERAEQSGKGVDVIAQIMKNVRDVHNIKEPPKKGEVVLSPELTRWLELAGKELAPRATSTTNELRFVLKPGAALRAASLELNLVNARLNSDSTVREFKSFEYKLENLPGFAKDDLELLRLVRACWGSNYTLIDSNLTQQLLEKLLATKRCYWQEPTGTPLHKGEERPGQATWLVDAQGMQRPGFTATPEAAFILPLTPPWYIDQAQNTCGLLALEMPLETARVFITAPPITHQVTNAFNKAFHQQFPHLPTPQVLETKREVVPCTPTLTLNSQPIGYYNSSMSDTATLEFYYGPVKVDKGTELFEVYKDGVIIQTPRDENAERAAKKLLGEMGFQKQASFYAHSDETYYFNHDTHWLEFLRGRAPVLKKQGWNIVVDESFRHKLATIQDWTANVSEESGWFGLELGIIIDGKSLPLVPLLVGLLRRMPNSLTIKELEQTPDDRVFYAVLDDGRSVALPVERIRPILSVLIELYMTERGVSDVLRLPLLDAARLAELEASLQLRWLGGERLLELGRKLRSFRGVEDMPVPSGLQATMRPYQQQGLSWLQFLREYELGGVLADDMGLGKTIQTLSHILTEKEAGRMTGPSLVIAPTSVLNNWKSEAQKFTPGLKPLVLYGKERAQHFNDIKKHDVVITSYPLLLRDLDVHNKHQYHLLVLDEAQNIKNSRSSSAKAVSSLKAKHRLCLSGTPLENHLGELWSLFNFLMPGLLGDETYFKKLYRTPIEKHSDTGRQRSLATRVKPFLLRRTKELVAKELPDKTETVIKLELEDGQRDLYETLRVSMHERVRGEIESKGLARSQIMILDALLKLRQVCCDPRLVKLEKAKKVKQSAKLEWLTETLPNMLDEGRKVLLFSQFTSMLSLVEEELAKLNIPYAKLIGDTKDRKEQVELFQSGRVPLFLLSLKAGGVGLNLTAADTVIHYDPWWNPAAENQATDRAHRIGQDKKVFVYKLIAEGSLEEKIIDLQKRKAALAKGILEGGDGALAKLTLQDLEFLFQPLE
jgi:superfamily II DNA or RNA helicase